MRSARWARPPGRPDHRRCLRRRHAARSHDSDGILRLLRCHLDDPNHRGHVLLRLFVPPQQPLPRHTRSRTGQSRADAGGSGLPGNRRAPRESMALTDFANTADHSFNRSSTEFESTSNATKRVRPDAVAFTPRSATAIPTQRRYRRGAGIRSRPNPCSQARRSGGTRTPNRSRPCPAHCAREHRRSACDR
jgi:hypothetical protein